MFFEPFILAGGMMFYALLAVFAVVMLAAVEYDNGWGSVWALVIFVAILSQATDIAVIGYMMANPWSAAEWAVYYFVAGTVWGVAKWWFYCRKLLDVARDVKMAYLNSINVQGNEIPEDKREKFISGLLHTRQYTDNSFPPQAMEHKSDWMMWAAYWPFSFFWTMLNQPIKHIWQFIYSHLGSFMQKISNAVFKEI